VILLIAYGGISVARYLIIRLGDGSWYDMRMKIAARLGMNQPYDIFVADESQRLFRVIRLCITVGIEEPIIVRIFVMITCYLLLLRPFRVGLDVRMKQTAAVAHVLQRRSRAVSNLKRAVLSDFCSFEVCLEQRTHLRVTGPGVFQDQKMYIEGKHVYEQGDDNKPHDS
jgi:hypothetical protein